VANELERTQLWRQTNGNDDPIAVAAAIKADKAVEASNQAAIAAAVRAGEVPAGTKGPTNERSLEDRAAEAANVTRLWSKRNIKAKRARAVGARTGQPPGKTE
jgi:hypothetical protein